MTAELFSTCAKINTSSQWGKQLVDDITLAFSKLTKIVDYFNENFAAATQQINNSISEAKKDILLSGAAVERLANAAKLQTDTNAF